MLKGTEASILVVQHPFNSYTCHVIKVGGGGLRSIETEYKEMKVKTAVNLYQNRDPALKMVRNFEERVESLNTLIQPVSQRRER